MVNGSEVRKTPVCPAQLKEGRKHWIVYVQVESLLLRERKREREREQAKECLEGNSLVTESKASKVGDDDVLQGKREGLFIRVC